MKISFILILCVFFLATAYADTIYLKNGTSVRGEISEEGADFVTVREPIDAAVTRIISFPRVEIEKIEMGEEEEEGLPQPAKKVRKAVEKKENSANEEEKEEKSQAKETENALSKRNNQAPLRDIKSLDFQYQVAARKDKSFLGFIRMKRMETTVVIPDLTRKEHLPLLFLQILKDELNVNPDLDALWIVVYPQSAYGSGVPLMYAVWSPPGGWDDFREKDNKSKYQWDYRYLLR